MHYFETLTLKDVLDWVMPILITWLGSRLLKFFKDAITELSAAKDSVIQLNKRMGEVIEILQNHEVRIQHFEHRVKK